MRRTKGVALGAITWLALVFGYGAAKAIDTEVFPWASFPSFGTITVDNGEASQTQLLIEFRGPDSAEFVPFAASRIRSGGANLVENRLIAQLLSDKPVSADSFEWIQDQHVDSSSMCIASLHVVDETDARIKSQANPSC